MVLYFQKKEVTINASFDINIKDEMDDETIHSTVSFEIEANHEGYAWARRKNGSPILVNEMKTELEVKAGYMASSSKFPEQGQRLCDVITQDEV